MTLIIVVNNLKKNKGVKADKRNSFKKDVIENNQKFIGLEVV